MVELLLYLCFDAAWVGSLVAFQWEGYGHDGFPEQKY